MREVYVVSCCRTAIGSFGGSLKDVPAPELGSAVIREAVRRAGIAPEQAGFRSQCPPGRWAWCADRV